MTAYKLRGIALRTTTPQLCVFKLSDQNMHLSSRKMLNRRPDGRTAMEVLFLLGEPPRTTDAKSMM